MKLHQLKFVRMALLAVAVGCCAASVAGTLLISWSLVNGESIANAVLLSVYLAFFSAAIGIVLVTALKKTDAAIVRST